MRILALLLSAVLLLGALFGCGTPDALDNGDTDQHCVELCEDCSSLGCCGGNACLLSSDGTRRCSYAGFVCP